MELEWRMGEPEGLVHSLSSGLYGIETRLK
jgi:hypothetical protein